MNPIQSMASYLLLRGIDTKADMRVKFRRWLKRAWGSLSPRDFVRMDSCSALFQHSIANAILVHGGEGETVRDRFFALSPEDQQAAFGGLIKL